MASFGVYKTVDTNASQFVLEDNKKSETDGGPGNTLQLVPGSFISEHLDSIVRHHRTEVDARKFHERLFVIVDVVDWRKEGVLLVNLDADGLVDSFRQGFTYGVSPGGVLNAVDVEATGWQQMKQFAVDWARQGSIGSTGSSLRGLVSAAEAAILSEETASSQNSIHKE